MNKYFGIKIGRLTQLVLALVFFSMTGNVKSQRNDMVLNLPTFDQERVHFGFALALHQLFVTIRPIDSLSTTIFQGDDQIPDITPVPAYATVNGISCTPGFGFTISIIGDLRMGEYFNLRFLPSFIYGSRTLNYSLQTYYMNLSTMKIDTFTEEFSKEVPSTYISFPLEVKYKAARYNNFRPYIMAGAVYSLDLASEAKRREKKSQSHVVKLNQNDFYIEAGVGFDLYMEWFKLGIELKMMYGLNDMLTHDGTLYTESIESLRSKIFQLSFTFE